VAYQNGAKLNFASVEPPVFGDDPTCRSCSLRVEQLCNPSAALLCAFVLVELASRNANQTKQDLDGPTIQ
jgi:hypothetical protein